MSTTQTPFTLTGGGTPVEQNDPAGRGGFSCRDERSDVAVLVVTFNNEADLPELLECLRRETEWQTIKVIVADNSPAPSATLELLAAHADVFAFSTGGNLGYAGAINAALRMAGDAGAYLVLNPDLIILPGSIHALRTRLCSGNAGVVVPLLLDEDGSRYPSLRREPSLCRAVGDALMGSRVPSRLPWLSEIDHARESYQQAHQVDWATGAALLIRSDVCRTVGEWDERFFLYSEETDYLRRVRSAGFEVWFEPNANMIHSRGGSGSSPALDALMAVNRIRYVRKFHSSLYSQAFHCAVILSALLRAFKGEHRVVLSTVLRRKLRARLPKAAMYVAEETARPSFPAGAVIIPAHNEAMVIGRTLQALKPALDSGSVEVIVACNGCRDETATIARSYRGVQVLEVSQPSKMAALNAGDEVATQWPRLYLDADIELPAEALRQSLEVLSGEEGLLAARPAFVYDTQGASKCVRAFYRVRNRMPQASEFMWGAGIYGLSQVGHQRLGRFPSFTGDDCYVDGLFTLGEKSTLDCEPVRVRTPRTSKTLIATLGRIYRGNAQLRETSTSHTRRTVRELLASVRGPLSGLDAIVYVGFVVAGRISGKRSRSKEGWERDESSRMVAGPSGLYPTSGLKREG